jgi:hypothetical protein
LGRLTGGCGLDSAGSEQGPVAGSCECGDVSSGSSNTKFDANLKTKAFPLHATKALGAERRYSSYSFSTSTLDGCEWSSRPGRT